MHACEEANYAADADCRSRHECALVNCELLDSQFLAAGREDVLRVKKHRGSAGSSCKQLKQAELTQLLCEKRGTDEQLPDKSIP
jgi:hypothetical protein